MYIRNLFSSLRAFLSAASLITVASVSAQAAGLPVVISATVNYTNNTLTIGGQNFGSSPTVTLDSMAFPTMSSASNQIVADFPSGTPPSSFTPGTYFLTLQFKNQLPAIFAVAIGANGPMGATGPQGPAGATGATGALGPAGPAGPTGSPGSTGMTGAQGPGGPVGATGPQGPGGPQGPQGVPGTNGTNGTGAPSCSATDTVVSYQGALVCKSTLPRYIANGDGTVTDNQTGLMWEMQTSACAGEVTCVNNSYTWSSSGTAADGTLFTGFIAGLNGGEYYDPSIGLDVVGGAGGCFANHCDWRIPTSPELEAIVELTAPGCPSSSPCTDPAFGPSQGGAYWTLSSFIPFPTEAWVITNTNYGTGGPCNGLCYFNTKTGGNYARAVRTAH